MDNSFQATWVRGRRLRVCFREVRLMILNLACNSKEEADHLYPALNDFSESGPRAAYANWLEQQGDKGRAETVRATIKAYQTFDLEPLKEPQGEPIWQSMLAISKLEALIEAQEFASLEELKVLRDQVFKMIRPCLNLRYEEADSEPELGASYLWGRPDLASGEAWPTVAECSDWSEAKEDLPAENHCAFVGQFRYDDLASSLLGRELPAKGGFSVFCITEVEELGVIETVIRPWDPEAELTRRDHPEDLVEDALGDGINNPQPFHTLILEDAISIPDATCPAYGSLIEGCQWGEPFHDVYEGLSWGNDEGLGLGGYLSGTSGDDPSPDNKHLRFAVLRSHPEEGVVHFAIPAEDQKSGRLDRVKYVWSDWDS